MNIMNKQIIRLTESDLHRIIKESVQTILKEYSDETYGKIYNDVDINTPDIAYNERAKRLKNNIGKHVARRNGVDDEAFYNYSTKNLDKMSNRQLKGVSKLKKIGMPYHPKNGKYGERIQMK